MIIVLKIGRKYLINVYVSDTLNAVYRLICKHITGKLCFDVNGVILFNPTLIGHLVISHTPYLSLGLNSKRLCQYLTVTQINMTISKIC